MEATTPLERQRVHALAEEYRGKGYKVIKAPSPEQLPDFLADYHPDLLVQKDDEAIIVEVKSRSSLAKQPQIRELARLLHAKPNWNFELVVVSEEEPLRAPEGARPFEPEDILRSLEAAESLLETGFSEAALLLVWPTLEASVRRLTEADDISLDRLTPLYVLKQAVIHGLISRDDYNFLTNVMKYRNALVHGFKTIDFDPALVQELISTTKRLLQSTTAL